MKREAFIVALALLVFFGVGGLGAYLCATFSTPSFFFSEELDMMYWLRWMSKIVGRLCGDFLCGVLLGRYLNRVKVRYFLLFISLYLVAVLVLNGFFVGADEGKWLESVGVGGAILQLMLQGGMILGTVAFGIWIGRRWKRVETLKQIN